MRRSKRPKPADTVDEGDPFALAFNRENPPRISISDQKRGVFGASNASYGDAPRSRL